MKAMVVGGAGFIGSHLCEALIDRGDSVVCVDNMSLGNEANVDSLIKHEKMALVKVDAAVYEDLLVIFKKYQPEYVFHLAASSDIKASSMKPAVEYRNTYTTTFNILSAMRECGIRKLFFSSTSAVYGDKRDELLSEETPNLSPISYYGAAKLGSEALISAFSYMNDFSSLVFRFPNVIGPHLTHGVIYDFVNKLRNNPVLLEILGDGRQEKPYIYVSDLVGAIIKFLDAPKGVSLYNLGVEGSTSVTRIAEIVVKGMELKEVKFSYTGGESGWKGDVPRFRYDLSKIHSAGWHARYNSDEAVEKTVREYLKMEG